MPHTPVDDAPIADDDPSPENRRRPELRFHTRLGRAVTLFDQRDAPGAQPRDTAIVGARPLYPVAVEDGDGTVRVATHVWDHPNVVGFDISVWGPDAEDDPVYVGVTLHKAEILAHRISPQDIADLYLDGGVEATELLQQLVEPEDEDTAPVPFLEALTSVRASFDLPPRGAENCGGTRTPPPGW